LEEDRRRYHAAFEAIRAQPRAFVWASALRLAWLWSPLPHRVHAEESRFETLARYGTCAWFVLAYALAAIGAVRLNKRLLRSPWIWALSLCLVFTAVHAFYWTNMRMRAPLEPVICLLAAAAVAKRAPEQART
jgi:hypothetical protein